MAMKIKAKEKPPYVPNKYPGPACPPTNTGTPTSPSNIQISPMKKDSASGNTSAIRVITKFKRVMCVPFGSGMLI